MVELRRRVSSKVAYTAGRTGCKTGQLPGRGSGPAAQVFTECPVLTVEAVKTAAFVKNGEIPKSVLRPWPMGKPGITRPSPSRTDPIGHAIGGQGIIIPAYLARPWGNTDHFALLVGPEAAVALLSLRDGTHICTDGAHHTRRISGNGRWKAKGRSGKSVGLQHNGLHLLWGAPDAVEAYRKNSGERGSFLPADPTPPCTSVIGVDHGRVTLQDSLPYSNGEALSGLCAMRPCPTKLKACS